MTDDRTAGAYLTDRQYTMQQLLMLNPGPCSTAGIRMPVVHQPLLAADRTRLDIRDGWLGVRTR